MVIHPHYVHLVDAMVGCLKVGGGVRRTRGHRLDGLHPAQKPRTSTRGLCICGLA